MSKLQEKYPDVPPEGDQKVCSKCGGEPFIFDQEVEEEGTYQAKVTFYNECKSCHHRWWDWERDWTRTSGEKWSPFSGGRRRSSTTPAATSFSFIRSERLPGFSWPRSPDA